MGDTSVGEGEAEGRTTMRGGSSSGAVSFSQGKAQSCHKLSHPDVKESLVDKLLSDKSVSSLHQLLPWNLDNTVTGSSPSCGVSFSSSKNLM